MHEHPNRLHKVACQLASVLLGAGLLTSAIATPSHAVTPPNKMGAHPTWGTCGLTSSQMKLVYDFGPEVLYCGSASSFGYLHIKAGKQTSFAPLAAAVGRTWEDLLWFSIAWAQNDPDASRYNPANGKYCVSRVLILANSNGLVVSRKVYKTIYVTGGKIITSFPTDTQCRNTDVQLSGAEPVSMGML